MAHYWGIQSAQEILDRVLQKIPQDNTRATEFQLYRNWAEYVGTDIAAHSAPVELEGHTLLIEVDHPAWLQKLQLHSSAIIRQVNKKSPSFALKALRLHLT